MNYLWWWWPCSAGPYTIHKLHNYSTVLSVVSTAYRLWRKGRGRCGSAIIAAADDNIKLALALVLRVVWARTIVPLLLANDGRRL